MGSDVRLIEPEPDDARGALLDAVATLVPGWRPLARGILGSAGRIDWLGCDGSGRAVLVLLENAESDLGLLGRGLAQREWSNARLADWAQLAPQAGLQPEAGVFTLLCARSFSPAALSAARALTPGDWCLASLRFVRSGDQVSALLEAVYGASGSSTGPTGGAAGFRSGLEASDLDLSPEELAEFDDPDA